MYKVAYKKRYVILFFILVNISVLISGCTQDKKSSTISNGNEVPVLQVASDGNASSSQIKADELSLKGVIVNQNDTDNTLTVRTLGTQDEFVYIYNGATDVLDRYGKILTMKQLSLGEVVDIVYTKGKKKLKSVKVSDGDWERVKVSNFGIDTVEKKISIGSDKYDYDDNLVVVSGDMICDIEKLESIDTITLKGRDKQLDSIIVTSGHGYVALNNTSFFEGGFIEIGSKIVECITQDMVLPVPVGDYTMVVTKGDTKGSTAITVSENEQLSVDLLDYQSEAVKCGGVKFNINPDEATLKVDGKVRDASKLINLPYGTHTVKISMNGYGDYKETITVDEIYKEYNISLIQSNSIVDEDETTTTNTTASKNSESTKESTQATTKSSYTATTSTIDYDAWQNILSGLLN